MRWSAAAFALLLPASLVAGQQTPAPVAPARPQFTARTELVTVDVSVFDQQGRPVEGLGNSDFIVLVDGRPRRVSALSAHASVRAPLTVPIRDVGQSPVDAAREPDTADTDPTGSRPRALDLPVPARLVDRRFVVLVDREHVRAGEGQQVLAAAARFINALPSSDRVAYWTLPGRHDKLDFDESRESVVRKVRRAIGVYRPLSDPASPGFWDLNLLDRRQRAADFLQSVRDLLMTLLGVEGPKHVVIVSGGGWMDTTNLGLIREVATLAAMARTQIHAMHVAPLPAAAARATAGDIPSECRDERMLSTGAAAYELSLLTGGFAELPGQGLVEGAGFDRLSRQLSAWYLLGFESTATDRDGRPHRVDVQLANRPGVSVRVRRMFYVEPGVVAREKTEAPPPPPAAEWNKDAQNRTILGLVPFSWMPEWLDAAQRFCRSPELGPDVEAICHWDGARLQHMTTWLAFVTRYREKVGQPSAWAGPQALRAAALLHTAAYTCQMKSGAPDLRQLQIGSQLLGLSDGPTGDGRTLHRLWYSIAPQVVSAYGSYVDALKLLRAGLTRFPDDAELHFVAGTLHEALASPILAMYHYNVEERIERSQQVQLSLDEAAKAYRRAIEIAPTSAEARLRLGRVLALLGRPEEAKTAFERVIAEGADEETRWLAHMFLGRVHEQAGRHVEAITSYRRALGLRATQSATIALANALDRSGERDAAVAQLQLLATTADQSTGCEDGCDPWLRYNLVDRGRVSASLQALVQQACEAPR